MWIILEKAGQYSTIIVVIYSLINVLRYDANWTIWKQIFIFSLFAISLIQPTYFVFFIHSHDEKITFFFR